MSESNRQKLWWVAGFVVLAHSVDVASTYSASPDLVGEWNLLHRQLHLGWTGLIAAKAVWATLAVIGYAFYLRFRTLCYPHALDRHNGFYRFFAFGPPQARRASDRQMAWLRTGIHLGYLLVGLHGLVLWAAIDNMLLGIGLSNVLQNLSEHGYHAFQAVLVTALTLARF